MLEALDATFSAIDEPELPTVHVGPEPRGPGALFWLAAALLLAAAGTGGWYVAELDRRARDLQAAVDAANALTERTNAALDLAHLQAGDFYQLWFVLPEGPLSAALVEPNLAPGA
jgi:hypothetical protein